MIEGERVQLDTNVRRRWSRLGMVLLLLGFVALGLSIGRAVGVWPFLVPAPFVLWFSRRVVRARVIASAEGLRIGKRLIPREAFTSGLVRHEGDDVFVALDGRERIDIAVKTNSAADTLLQALRLDAASAVVEIPLVREEPKPFRVLGIVVMVFTLLMFRALQATMFGVLATGGVLALAFWAARLAREVKLDVGADGILIRALMSRRFLPHDAIRDVHAEGDVVVIQPTSGDPLRFDLPSRRANREHESTAAHERRRDEVDAIVRRIRQARVAFREGASAPELSVALDRGARTTREWLADLRRLGQGAASTFRTIGVAREQLFGVVESTTATAKDRVAALVALKSELRDDEKPRIRVATDRIAEPALRDRMIRVLEADDAELEGTLEELKADPAAGESQKNRS